MKTILVVAAAATAVAITAPVRAEQATAATVEQTYKEIEAAYGVMPGFVKAYPKSAIAGAWALTKELEMNPDSELDLKTTSLINIAVAAQIPCRYCIWLDTKMAKQQGATEEEIAEAVAQAGLTRHWSTALKGMQIDFETFKAEFGGGS